MGTTRRWISFFALALIAFGCGDSRSQPIELAFEGFHLAVSLAPETARVGENTLWLELRGHDGEPLDGALVEAAVRMHAMGAMAAMGGPAPVVALGEGRYRADFELAMGSTWQVEVTVGIGDGTPMRAEGSLTVGRPGLQLAVVAGDGTAGMDGVAGLDAAAHPASDSRHPAEFVLTPERMQRIGVSTAVVERKTIPGGVRAVGRIVAPESELVDVSLKVRGWARRIVVDAAGDPVESGGVLFEVYSPDLLAAQQEYVEALRSQARARDTSVPDRADALVRAAHDRLRLWDIAPRDLERLTTSLEVIESIPIRAPISGYVVEKNLVEGGAFEPGERLYRIAPLTKVWIEAEVYESELGRVAVGERATVTLPYLPGRSLEARITYIQPSLDAGTRTARVRLELDNRDRTLRPNMYANVQIEAPGIESLVVPQSAVLQAGRQSFVFRVLGEGRFRPQAVGVGQRIGEEIEILSGLEEGDVIVRSGTFLVAAESRLRAAMEQW